MKQTLLMETLMGQTRLAVVEDGALCELYSERPDEERVSGNIYLGRVENVLPGMNAAFVDIGLKKNGFLCAGDIRLDLQGDPGLAAKLGEERVEARLRPGREVLVQVTKDATGQKGPRVSGHVTLPGRAMVLLPKTGYVGVSRRIADPAERERLSAIARELLGNDGMGLILRTAAEGLTSEALASEYRRLLALWQQIELRANHGQAPKLLYADGGIALRAVRDRLGEDTEALWVDDAALFESVLANARLLAPQWADRVKRHEGSVPLFDLYRVDTQADRASEKRVWLKNGGFLVIDETEALTVIDVNTGKYTGKRDVSETLYRNNCEAAREIMRQMRLRDIGGIIIVDFIDMDRPEQRQALLEELRELAARDRNRVSVVDITGLGLVEMTRKRIRQTLSRRLSRVCPQCGGSGVVPSDETTARRIVRDVWRRRRMGEDGALLVEASEPVCDWLKALGAPDGRAVYARPVDGIGTGEYRLSPADESALPAGSKKLK